MKIYTKIAALKKEVGKMTKDLTNPFYKSKYFDINQLLEQVEPLAEKYGLLIIQPIMNNRVCTNIIDIESGKVVVSEIELTGIKDPQKVGSEITYYRRYTLQSLLALQTEDDDANSTAKTPQNVPYNAPQKASTTNENEVEKEWINLTNRDGSPTKIYEQLHTEIKQGRIVTMAELRNKYKINKKDQEILTKEFNIN